MFVSPSLTSSPSFPVFPSALLTSAVLAALPPGSRPALTFVNRPGLGSLSSACPGPGLWAVGEIPVFNRYKAPVRGKAWSRGARGQPASAQLPLSEAAFLALSSGSEWPGGGSLAPSSRGGEKAIMSRDRGWGSSTGLWRLRAGSGSGRPRMDGPLSPRGTRSGRGRLAVSPAPSAALLTLWMRQEEHEGASLPSHQPRALPGLPSGRPYLPLEPGPGPSPFGGRGPGSPPSLCLEWRGASLGCYTSCTETVLGPPGGLGLRGGGLGVWYVLREGPLALSCSLGLTFCSLKVNVSVLWALACVPQTVSVCGRPCASGVQMHVACVCGCVGVCVCVWCEWARAPPLAQALHPEGEGRWPSRGASPGAHLLPCPPASQHLWVFGL